jgi:hypothetical protein
MSDPLDDLKSFFSTTKALKSKGKVIHLFVRYQYHLVFH